MTVKYKAVKKGGYGECFSDNINYIIENVDKWCGPDFDLYVDGVKVYHPKQYLEDHKPKEPQTLEEKIVDMCYKIDHLKQENQQLKEVIEEVREYIINTYDDVVTAFTEDKPMTNFKARKELLQILEKSKGE